MKKMNKIWWVFSILSLVFGFLNPYFGFFAMINVIALFFDIISFIILSANLGIYKRKIADRKIETQVGEKMYFRELTVFKLMKIFTTIAVLFTVTVVIKTNLNIQSIMTPFYLEAIAQSTVLQWICTGLSVVSAILSCILFWFFLDTRKIKFKET